ncbi:MAG: Smr/MutS family protein [Gammaproteobacteria bacterium]
MARPRITDEERKLFRDAAEGVRPLKPGSRSLDAEPTRKRPKPIPKQSRADERAVLAELADAIPDGEVEMGDELSWRVPGLQDSVLRKLRRGQYRVDRALDLHGHTAASAKLEVAGFLQRAAADGIGCVRIVHGKGRGSKEGRPILKQLVGGWLRNHKGVLAYVSARQVDGGTGAVVVLLRKK